MQTKPRALGIAAINKILNLSGQYVTNNHQEMDRIVRAAYSGSLESKFIYKHFLDALKNPELADCLEFRVTRTQDDRGLVSKCFSMVNTKTNEKISSGLKNEPDDRN